MFFAYYFSEMRHSYFLTNIGQLNINHKKWLVQLAKAMTHSGSPLAQAHSLGSPLPQGDRLDQRCPVPPPTRFCRPVAQQLQPPQQLPGLSLHGCEGELSPHIANQGG